MSDEQFAEYRKLANVRDLRAYETAGIAQLSVAWMNLGEYEKAHKALFESVARYQAAAEAVERFHQTRKSNEKEQPNGNATAAA